jgi:hypothetical protein
MIRALGLGHHELAADQLEGLALEHTELDQAVVFRPLPAADGEGNLPHGHTVAVHLIAVNVRGRIRRAPAQC